MRFKWNFKELFDFGDRLGDYEVLETGLMTATKEIAKALHAQLLINTPIDTGNLRKMWSAGDNLSFTVKPTATGYEVTLINTATNKRYPTDNYPEGFVYAHAVNYGHRKTNGGWVMGKFFLERSVVQVSESAKLERIVYQELEKWFRGCVGG